MKSLSRLIPNSIKELLIHTSFYRRFAIRNKLVIRYSEVDEVLNQAPILTLNKELEKKPRVGIIKSQLSILGEDFVKPKASWLRYERFCKNNNIPYGFYDISKHDWLVEAQKYDVIICHTESTPAYQDMIESKIYVLDKIVGKFCFPSYHEVWQYENKNRSNYLYQYYNLPSIPTYVTQNKKDAIELSEQINYPFITKTTIGSASVGVAKIDNLQQARKRIKAIFGRKGLKTIYPYERQKDYFYIQEYIEDATYDLRIMLVGDMAFGYYRYPNKGDFRASGAGNTEKKEIPEEALRLAVDIRNKLQSRLMGVDLLFSSRHNQYLIIETSLFNQIDTPIQFALNGVPGYYDISDINNIQFKEGKFWIQELLLRDVINSWSKKMLF